jgi:hypothetical protein
VLRADEGIGPYGVCGNGGGEKEQKEESMATRILTEEDKRALEARMGAAPQGVSRGLRLLTEVDRQELERKIDEAGPNIQLEALTVIPTKESQAVTAPEGTAYDRIRVDPIPDRFQDVSGVTAQPEQVLDGVYFVDSTGERKEGRIPARSAGDLTVSGLTVSVPAGYTGKTVTLPAVESDGELTKVRDITLNYQDGEKVYKPWHIDVIEDNGKTVLLVMCKSGTDWSLFLSTSDDNVTFTIPELVMVGNPYGWDTRLYRSSIVNVDGEYRIYYSAQDETQKYGLGVSTSNTLSNFVGKW